MRRNSLWFSVTVLLLLAFGEFLTFQMPGSWPPDEAWSQLLMAHLMLVLIIAAGSLVGALLGFRFFPAGRHLTSLRLVILGGVFVCIAFFAIPPSLDTNVLLAAFLGACLLAVGVVQTAGRLLARKEAS